MVDVHSFIINLLSSIIYDFMKYKGDPLIASLKHEKKWNEESIKIQLKNILEQFFNKNEENLFLDTDWFADHFRYQHPTSKIIAYVLGSSYVRPVTSRDDLISILVCDTQKAAERKGRGLSSWEKSIVKELYQLLIDATENILRGQMDIGQQYGLHKIQETIWQATELQDARFTQRMNYRKRRFSEKRYEYPIPHIKRYCHSQENDLMEETKEEEERADKGGEGKLTGRFQLTEICQVYSWVVVLGEAGSGKSTELQWTAAYYSENVDLPRPVCLTLKTYIDETIESLAEKQGVFIEEKRGQEENCDLGEGSGQEVGQKLFFLIDGFDEISGENRQNFLKQLTAYHEQNPEARFLVSSRNNFYHPGILGEWFKTVWMEPLGLQDVINFVRELGIDDQAFLSEIDRQNLRELLLIPFYLIELCGIYQEKGELPQRNQLMRELIEHKFAEDLKKFRMTMDVDLAELKPHIFSLLQKIAIAMHAMDCRSLQEENYQSLIPSSEDRKYLSFSGIWKQQQDGWQFSHNNFGEYLAAEYLYQCSLDEIKTLVSAGHPELGICKNWHHVLSYLLVMENKQIEEWLLEQDFTLFFDFDASRLPASVRSKVLRKEWERLKCQHEWIISQPYRVEKLMQFGVSYLEIHMFLEEIRNPSDIISQQNAILALEYCPDLFGCHDMVRDVLMEVCKMPQEHECVYERAILGLLEMDLMREEDLAQLMAYFETASAPEVRYALYRSIRVLGKADKYIHFLVDGLSYISEKNGINQSRLVSESFELHYAMMEVKGTAAMEIIKELTKDRMYSHIFGIRQVVENIFSRFTESRVQFAGDEWNCLIEFYEKVSYYGWRNMEESVLSYFVSIGMKTVLFEDQLKKIIEGKRSWIYLIRLFDDTVSQWVLTQYRKGDMDDQQAKLCIDCMHRNNPIFAPLTAIYREKTGIQIPDKQEIDCDKSQRSGKDNYQKAIIDKEKYLSLVDELICLYGKEELTEKDIERNFIEEAQNRYDLMEVKYDYCRSGYMGTVQEWRNVLEKRWEDVEGCLLINWLRMHGNEKGNVPDELKAAARRYFDRNIESMDFSNAVEWLTDKQCQIKDCRGQRLLYFAWRFDFRMEREKAEGILTAAHFLDENQIRDLLERHFSKEELEQMVLYNMVDKELKGDDLHLHLWYCIKWKISQCAEMVCRIAVDAARPEWIRRRAVEYFYKVIGEEALCQAVLPSLDGNLFLEAVSWIVDSKPEGLEDLLWEYAEKNEKDKLFCYKQLIQLQDNRGLKAYREILEQERKIKEYTAVSQPLESIGNIRKEKLWGELLELLKLWSQPDFEDAETGGLTRALGMAFCGIARSGERGFQAVKAMLKEQMQWEQIEFGKKVQLQHWMRNAEESYKQSVQQKWSVGKAKEYVFS